MSDEITATPEAAQSPEPVAPTPSPYQCKDCGKVLSGKQSLKNHVGKFHPKAGGSTETSSAAPVEQEKKAETAPAPEKKMVRQSFLDRSFFRR
jgi:hypothetical protein